MNKHVIYFYTMSKPLNPTPLILDIFVRQGVRGQLKMDTKNTPLPLNTTRLILMRKTWPRVPGQTIKSKN